MLWSLSGHTSFKARLYSPSKWFSGVSWLKRSDRTVDLQMRKVAVSSRCRPLPAQGIRTSYSCTRHASLHVRLPEELAQAKSPSAKDRLWPPNPATQSRSLRREHLCKLENQEVENARWLLGRMSLDQGPSLPQFSPQPPRSRKHGRSCMVGMAVDQHSGTKPRNFLNELARNSSFFAGSAFGGVGGLCCSTS